MKYLMLICHDPSIEENEAEMSAESWVEEMDRRGIRLQGSEIDFAKPATTVRVREGEALVTDGPFAETKEAIVGYDLIECADRAEAIEVARKHPMARFGAVDLRALPTR